MGGIFGLLANSMLLKVVYPLLIVVVGYGVSAYFRLGWLEAKVEKIQKENYELQVELSVCKEVVDGATGQISLAEEQCRRLLQYVENQPRQRPSTDDDSDIDDLVNRLHGKPSGTKNDADGQGPGSTAP